MPATIIYPNPTRNSIHLSSIAPEHYEVYSLLGERVLKGIANGTIDISRLPNGRYYFRLSATGKLAPFTVLR